MRFEAMTTDGRQDPCETFAEDLTDYLAGTLPTDRRPRVREHLGECEECRRESVDRTHWMVRQGSRLTGASAPARKPGWRMRWILALGVAYLVLVAAPQSRQGKEPSVRDLPEEGSWIQVEEEGWSLYSAARTHLAVEPRTRAKVVSRSGPDLWLERGELRLTCSQQPVRIQTPFGSVVGSSFEGGVLVLETGVIVRLREGQVELTNARGNVPLSHDGVGYLRAGQAPVVTALAIGEE